TGVADGGSAGEAPPADPTGGATKASTTGTTATTSTATKATKATKKATPTTSAGGGAQDPSQPCERGLRDYLQSRLGAPPGGGVLRVRVRVADDGGASLLACDGCGDD